MTPRPADVDSTGRRLARDCGPVAAEIASNREAGASTGRFALFRSTVRCQTDPCASVASTLVSM
jgi:hypothetical protein